MLGALGGGESPSGNEEAPTTSIKDEPSIIERRVPKPIPVPTRMTETISVRICPKQGLGIIIRKSDSRVTVIHGTSPLLNKISTGDRLLKINDAPLDIPHLLKAATPHEPGQGCRAEICGADTVTVKVTIERAVFSWCRLEATTLEQIFINKKQEPIITGRPLKRFTVALRRPTLPGIKISPLGLSLRYDPRDRVTVAAVEAGSVASAHLHPGDMIKRVNEESVNTKTMCAFAIIKSLHETGQVVLSLEVLDMVDTSSRDRMEMPEDVVAICAKQIAVIKSGVLKTLPSITLRPPPSAASAARPTTPGKAAKREKRVTAGTAREEEIVSDTPEGTTLKKANLANNQK